MSLFGTVERFGGGNHSWLGSRHAVDNAQPGTLKASEFDVDNGIVLSGTPVTRDEDDFYVPYAGSGELRFVLDDTSIIHGDRSVALIWHGLIVTDELPVELTAVADAGQFTFEPPFPAADEGGN